MKKIIILEDVQDQAFLVQNALVKLGFITVVLDNPFRAIESIRMKEFDVVATDLNMPEMGGEKFIAYVRKFDMEIPIVVITAYSDRETSARCFSAGANYVITKPFTINDLRLVFLKYK